MAEASGRCGAHTSTRIAGRAWATDSLRSVSTYERIADLPLEIEGYSLEGLSRVVSSGFERHTTVIRIQGGGLEGAGEDVTYDGDHQPAQQEAGPGLPLAGRWTFDSFSRHLGELDTFPDGPPKMPVYTNYRRWGFESAALDLALRQAGRSLADAVGREPRPITFVVSSLNFTFSQLRDSIVFFKKGIVVVDEYSFPPVFICSE